MSDKLTVRKARAALASDDEAQRQVVLDELRAIAAAEITDVLSWDALGRVTFLASDALDVRARKAIKKVRVTPTQFGNSIEVELHDKHAALRLLAKHHQLLEPQADSRRPALIGINLRGPEVVGYEVVDDDASTD